MTELLFIRYQKPHIMCIERNARLAEVVFIPCFAEVLSKFIIFECIQKPKK